MMKPRDKSLKGTAPPSPMLSAASTVVNSSLGPWEHRTARCRWKSKRGRSRLHHTRATPSSAALFTYDRPTKPDTVTALPASAAVSSASSAALLALGTNARESGCNVTAQQPRPPRSRTMPRKSRTLGIQPCHEYLQRYRGSTPALLVLNTDGEALQTGVSHQHTHQKHHTPNEPFCHAVDHGG